MLPSFLRSPSVSRYSCFAVLCICKICQTILKASSGDRCCCSMPFNLGNQLFLCLATIAQYHSKCFIPLLAKAQVAARGAASDRRRARHKTYSACCAAQYNWRCAALRAGMLNRSDHHLDRVHDFCSNTYNTDNRYALRQDVNPLESSGSR